MKKSLDRFRGSWGTLSAAVRPLGGLMKMATIAAFATTASFAQTLYHDLRLVDRSDDSITVTWTPSVAPAGDEVTHYRIRYDDGVTRLTRVVDAPPYTIQELTAATEYEIDIKTYFRDAATSSYSDPVFFSTSGGGGFVAPTIPQNVRATTVTSNSIALAWDASTASAGIRDYRVSWSGGLNPRVTETSHLFDGLDPDTEYTFKVKARDEDLNQSVFSDPITVRTESAGGGGGLQIGFDYPSDGASYDAANFGAGGGPWVSVSTNVGVTKVEFYINGYSVDTDTRDRSQYDYQYNFLQGGTYELTAVATGFDGSEASKTISVSVNRDDIRGQYNFKRLNGNRAIVNEQTFRDVGATRLLRNNEREYDNINGPTVLNVNGVVSNVLSIPSGVDQGLPANYYMYFAHHHGQYIRMAYARNIEGPWFLYNSEDGVARDELGVLAYENGGSTDRDDQIINLANNLTVMDHMASPDVVVEEGMIFLYFHALAEHDGVGLIPQKTFLAVNDQNNDGRSFTGGHIMPVVQSNYYASFWKYDGEYYGTQHQGRVLTHPDPEYLVAPVGPFDYSNNYWIKSSEAPFEDGIDESLPGVRHIKVEMEPGTDTLFATFSVTGDTPEQLYYRTLDMAENAPKIPNEWQAGPIKSLAVAEAGWEGGQFAVVPSAASAASGGVNQLRDPEIFIDNDGKKYVFYTGQGENAIGVAELEWVQ